jgi:hypothetical protein
MSKRRRTIAIEILSGLFVIAVLLAFFVMLLIYLVGRWAEQFFGFV